MTQNNIEMTISHMNNNLLRMSFLVETQTRKAVKALIENKVDIAEAVISEDIHINDLMRNIEDEAIRLIATQGPVASDLRNIFTIIKIVTDLERMGDHAKDIANFTVKNHECNIDLINEDIIKLTKLVLKLIAQSTDCFVAKDHETALELTKLDGEIVQMTNDIIKKLFEKAKDNPELIKLAADLQFVLKYLERDGDHAINICEWTIYIVTGQFKELN